MLAHSTILVHICRSDDQALRSAFLRPPLLRWRIAYSLEDHVVPHLGLAHRFHPSNRLSDMAILVQLDDMQTYRQLPCHLSMLQFDRCTIRHCHTRHSCHVHQGPPSQSQPESWADKYFRSRNLVSLSLLPFHYLIASLMMIPSCTVSSIARLVYAIDFVKGQYGILADDLDCEPLHLSTSRTN